MWLEVQRVRAGVNFVGVAGEAGGYMPIERQGEGLAHALLKSVHPGAVAGIVVAGVFECALGGGEVFNATGPPAVEGLPTLIKVIIAPFGLGELDGDHVSGFHEGGDCGDGRDTARAAEVLHGGVIMGVHKCNL